MTRLFPVLLLGVLLGGLGCVTREVKQHVAEIGGVEVFLRSKSRGFSTVERDFQHPVVISTQRLSHILGAIDIRGHGEDQAGVRAAFVPGQVDAVSEAVARGLKEANPNQEIAVRVTARSREFVVFSRKHLTSFVCYVQNDLLYLYFSRVDWKVPERNRKTDLPEPRIGDRVMKFRVEPTLGMYQEGAYAVTVEWENPIFSRPLRRQRNNEGRRERTILMEDSAPPPRPKPTQGIPTEVLGDLTPKQLRDLADLEEARQQGRLTEGRYRRRRKEILGSADGSEGQQERRASEEPATTP